MAITLEQVWKPSAADPQPKGRPLWWTIGPAGELAVLFVRRKHLSHVAYIAGWLGWVATPPFDGVLVVRHGDGTVEHRRIDGISVSPSHIGLLPDGRLLIAGGRVRQDQAGAWAHNAVVYSRTGSPEDSFCIGDDIDVLVTDSAGSLWTAYGDEGIYGSHPQSSWGLASWNENGQNIWTPDGRLPECPLAGHAAATEADHVWLVWYASSRDGHTYLTRITPLTGEVMSWVSPVPSTAGFAVRGNRAVLTRRKHNHPEIEVVHAELVDGAWTATERQRMPVPGRVVMHCGQGRDGVLWLRAGKTWLRTEA